MTSNLKQVHFNDFTGGLNTFNPANELTMTESPDLDNIILMNHGFKKRLGDSAYNGTAMNSGANIQGIAYHKPSSGTEYLYAVCGAKVFSSDAFDGTMDDVTGTATIVANQNNIYTSMQLNDKIAFVGGAPTVPFAISGAGNAANLSGTPPTGDFCLTMKDRGFIGVTSTSTLSWSILSNMEDWTGTGSGSQVVETSDGDGLVGGIPLNNDIMILFKNRSIHHLIVQTAPFPLKPVLKGLGCCGKLAMANVGGLVYFVSNQPRLYVTDGYTFKVVDTKRRIDNIWDGLNMARLKYIQMIHDPILNHLRIYCSYGSATTNNYEIIWDLVNNCWLRNTTSAKVNVACVASDRRIFGGAYDGKIYEKRKSGTYNDASETSPGIIKSYWNTAWLRGQSNSSVLHPRFMTVNFKTQTVGNVKYSYGFNYSANSDSGIIPSLQSGGVWGTGMWDTTFIWGGQDNSQMRRNIYGRGNNFQFKIYNDETNAQMEINSVSISMKEQGQKEITNV